MPPAVSPYLISLVLLVLVLSVFWQVGSHPFTVLDDPVYVLENPSVQRGLTPEGLAWAFTTFHSSNWHPLTWLSHMLDVELFGPDPGWHHRVNMFFHLLNTELLFLVLWRMTGGLWPSALVAATFGVHPLHVESVAWVAERKDLLSALFWFLTMGAYLRYVRRPGAGRYLLVVIPFALGLMAKPTLVTLPFVLLLLDLWPLGRMAPGDGANSGSGWISWRLFAPRLLEKLPLIALSAASSIVTYLAQAAEEGVVKSLEYVPFGMRFSNALVSYVAYLRRAIVPSSLAIFYPHPASIRGEIPLWEISGAILLLAGVTYLALRRARSFPYLAVGWFWYLGTLVPMIGIVQVGFHATADRYTYVPLIGIFLAMAWGVRKLLERWDHRQVAARIAAVVFVATLSAAAWVQAGYWRDDITLFSRAIAVTENNWFAWNNLGVTYVKLGQNARAAQAFREAVRIHPGYVTAWYNLGVALNDLGRYPEAVEAYREALRRRPDFVWARDNLEVALSNLRRSSGPVDRLKWPAHSREQTMESGQVPH